LPKVQNSEKELSVPLLLASLLHNPLTALQL
jgi:hypothetical protein